MTEKALRKKEQLAELMKMTDAELEAYTTSYQERCATNLTEFYRSATPRELLVLKAFIARQQFDLSLTSQLDLEMFLQSPSAA